MSEMRIARTESREWDGNEAVLNKESAWECAESVWKCEECWKLGWQCRDQGGDVSTAIEITKNNNENDKLKDRKKFKIKENEHICKNFLYTFDLVSFLLSLGIFLTTYFCLCYLLSTGKYRLGRLSKMEDLGLWNSEQCFFLYSNLSVTLHSSPSRF